MTARRACFRLSILKPHGRGSRSFTGWLVESLGTISLSSSSSGPPLRGWAAAAMRSGSMPDANAADADQWNEHEQSITGSAAESWIARGVAVGIKRLHAVASAGGKPNSAWRDHWHRLGI